MAINGILSEIDAALVELESMDLLKRMSDPSIEDRKASQCVELATTILEVLNNQQLFEIVKAYSYGRIPKSTPPGTEHFLQSHGFSFRNEGPSIPLSDFFLNYPEAIWIAVFKFIDLPFTGIKTRDDEVLYVEVNEKLKINFSIINSGIRDSNPNMLYTYFQIRD